MTDLNKLIGSIPKGANLKDFGVLIPIITEALGVDPNDEETLAQVQSSAARVLDSPMLGLFGLGALPGGASFSTGAAATGFDWNQILTMLLPAIIGFVQQQIQRAQDKPTAPPVQPTPPVPPPTAPPVTPPTAPPLPSPPTTDQRRGYASLRAEVSMFSFKGKVISKGTPEFVGIVTGNGNAQMVDVKAHLNISPHDQLGKEIRTGDPRHDLVGWDERGYPWLRYRWAIDGVQQQDTNNDHFLLSSIFSRNDPAHTFDFGCTPTLKLIQPWGAGKGKVTFQAYIDEERNGEFGYQESNIIEWFCD